MYEQLFAGCLGKPLPQKGNCRITLLNANVWTNILCQLRRIMTIEMVELQSPKGPKGTSMNLNIFDGETVHNPLPPGLVSPKIILSSGSTGLFCAIRGLYRHSPGVDHPKGEIDMDQDGLDR